MFSLKYGKERKQEIEFEKKLRREMDQGLIQQKVEEEEEAINIKDESSCCLM